MTINWVYQAYTPKKHDCGHQSLMLKSCFSFHVFHFTLLAECCCISTIIPLCTLPVEPFLHLLDFGALTKDSTVVNLC